MDARLGEGGIDGREENVPNRARLRTCFGDDYDEFKLGISFRIQAGQVVMQFSDHVGRIRMTGGGARKLAAMLVEKANEVDRLGSEGKSR